MKVSVTLKKIYNEISVVFPNWHRAQAWAEEAVLFCPEIKVSMEVVPEPAPEPELPLQDPDSDD